MTNHTNAAWPGWETVRLIGRGSFGGVYEIQRQIFDETEKAALKVISIPQNSGDIDDLYSDGYDEESITNTFKDHLKSIVGEYSLMRKLNGCTNIVNCDDMRYVQQDNGYGWDIYIKMELLTPLTKALPSQIPEEMVIRMAKDLCKALDICKQYNIIHRDIKPQNIFVSERGDYKLGDFGIAKTVEKTSGGTRIGTYKYIAPEVFFSKPYGSAADIYSLGLTLYWMLNERRMPFLPLPPTKLTVGMEEEARQRRLQGYPLPAPRNGSKKLKDIVLKACAYEPADRYQSAREMLEDLMALDAPGFRPVVSAPAAVAEADAEGTALLVEEDTDLLDRTERPEAEATGLLVENEETGLLAPEAEATGLLVENEETGLLTPEAEATGLLEENEETGLLVPEENAKEQTIRPVALEKTPQKAAKPVTETPKPTAKPWNEYKKPQEEQIYQEQKNGRRKITGIIALCAVLAVAVLTAVSFLFRQQNDTLSVQTTGPQLQEETVIPQDITVPSSEIPTDPVEITLRVWAPPEDQHNSTSWLICMERRFEELHPEYIITWENGVCYEGDSMTLVTADPVNAADVFLFKSDSLGGLVSAGALTKLEGTYLDFVQNNFSATYQSTLTHSEGGVYGFPMTSEPWFMYYNKSILSEEDVKSLEACLAKGKVAFDVRNAWYLPAFFFANGCTLFGETGNDPAAGVQFGGEAGYQAVSRVVDLVSNEPNFVVDGSGYGKAGLMNGSVAAYFSGNWDYGALYEALGENLGATAVPTVVINGSAKQMKAYANSVAVGVNPNAMYHNAAMEFAAFLASYESQLLRFELRGITPALSALAQNAQVSASIVASAEINTMIYASFPQPNVMEMNSVWAPLSTLANAIADGLVTQYNIKEKVDAMVAEAS